MIVSITLPWPNKYLFPNARISNKAKNAYIQPARELAFYTVKEQPQYDWTGLDGGLMMIVTAHPPDRIRRDLDNVLSSLKSYQDGLCQALGIDDRQIIEERISWGNVLRGGQIVMTLATRSEE